MATFLGERQGKRCIKKMNEIFVKFLFKRLHLGTTCKPYYRYVIKSQQQKKAFQEEKKGTGYVNSRIRAGGVVKRK